MSFTASLRRLYDLLREEEPRADTTPLLPGVPRKVRIRCDGRYNHGPFAARCRAAGEPWDISDAKAIACRRAGLDPVALAHQAGGAR